MIRGVLFALRSRVVPSLYPKVTLPGVQNINYKVPKIATFTSIVPRLTDVSTSYNSTFKYSKNLLLRTEPVSKEQVRTIVKFSWSKGKRKSALDVPARFFRLRWGIWIRTIAGRHKKLWKKRGRQKNFLKQHVFCNATQSKMLDTMVSKYWRAPKYYIDDPYEPYHKREEFTITRRKPWRPEGVDYE